MDATGQPYVYTGDDPVNGTDPEGLLTFPGWLPGGGVVTKIQNGITRGIQNAANNTCNAVASGVWWPGCVSTQPLCSPSFGVAGVSGGNLNWKPARYFKNAGIDPEELKDEYGFRSDGDLAVDSGTGRVFVGPKGAPASQMEPTNFRIVNGQSQFDPPSLGGDGGFETPPDLIGG